MVFSYMQANLLVSFQYILSTLAVQSLQFQIQQHMSVKVVQPELIQDDNYLTSENGCQMTGCSSEDSRALAKNIINNGQKIWMTCDPLPQQCTISVENMRKIPECFNVIGFYCWHQFDTNPSLIEVYIKYTINDNEILLGKFRLKQIDSWQFFKVQEIDPQLLQSLKIRICQTFGGKKAYLNQVALHSVNINSFVPTVRQSRSSTVQEKNSQNNDLMKYLSPPLPLDPRDKNKGMMERLIATEKNLSEANSQIIKLTNEQNSLKSTIVRQNSVIMQLEQKLRIVLIQMDKLHGIQEKMISGQIHSNSKSHSLKDQFENDQSQSKLKKMLEVFEQVNVEDGMKKKPGSVQKYQTIQPKKSKTKQPYYEHPPQNQIIRFNSDENFSEYSPNPNRMFGTHHEEQFSKTNSRSKANSGSKNKEELVQKIKLLLKLKEQKKSKLSAKKSSKYESAYNSHHIDSNDEDQQSGHYNGLEDSIDDEYFRKIRSRKIRANGI